MYPLTGGCDCGTIRYRMETPPLFVHCCHCRWCQRETGAAFALNTMIEADRITLLGAQPEIVDTPSASGKGQQIARCPKCRIAVWSNYGGSGPSVRFVRVECIDYTGNVFSHVSLLVVVYCTHCATAVSGSTGVTVTTYQKRRYVAQKVAYFRRCRGRGRRYRGHGPF